MDVDELQSVQSRERQTDSLQQLRESFYQEASEYIQQLREARDDAAERADDPWNSPEVSQLSDEIDTAEQTVEAIYDRRTGKIVKKASLAAAGMPTEEDGLTAEERTLFESLVEQIEANREHVLDKVAGEVAPDSPPTGATEAAGNATEPSDRPAPSTGPDPSADAAPSPSTDRPSESEQPSASESASPEQSSDVRAADLMGDGTSDEESPTPPPPPEAPPAETDTPAAAETSTDGGESTESGTADNAPAESGGSDATTDPAPNEGAAPAPDSSGHAVERTTVRITDDVGPIYGVDDREYDLSRDDVVTLPEANVGPLLDSGAAEEF